jgi:hypothetical protein
LDEACEYVARVLRARNLPVGRIKSDDATTITNWRKRASAGDPDVDVDAKTYLDISKRLLDHSSADSLVNQFMIAMSGITVLRKAKVPLFALTGKRGLL